MATKTTAKQTRAELIATLQNEALLIGDSVIRFHQAIGERMGLNPTEHKCVDVLFHSGPLTAGELATHTGLTTGAITGIIDRLETAGYARRERDETDRRKVVVRPLLEPELKALIDTLFAPLTAAMGKLCSSYNVRDLGIILEFVRCYSTTMREETTRLKEGEPADGAPDKRRVKKA